MRQFVFMIGLCLLPSLARSDVDPNGHIVGSNGDPLNLIFEKAKVDAQIAAQAFKPEVARALNIFQCDDVHAATCPNGKLVDFLVTQEPSLVDPQQRVPRYLNLALSIGGRMRLQPNGYPGQEACAKTSVPGQNPYDVFLDFDKCRSLIVNEARKDTAVILLLHEATHHFGTSDVDNQAQQMGQLIYEAWQAIEARAAERWASLSLQARPDGRYEHSGIFTGPSDQPLLDRKMIVWGGCDYDTLPNREQCVRYLGSGGLYDFADTNDHWDKQALPEEGAPSARKLHGMSWTGDDSSAWSHRVIIWGGYRHHEAPFDHGANDRECQLYGHVNTRSGPGLVSCTVTLPTGGIYDPVARQWQGIAADPRVPGRVYHSQLWTGATGNPDSAHALLIWGGLENFSDLQPPAVAKNDGWLYFPGQDTWRPLPPAPAALKGRFKQSTLLVKLPGSSEPAMIVWGGCERLTAAGRCPTNAYLGDGAILSLQTLTWRYIPAQIEVSPRIDHSAVWTGEHMIVFGGDFRDNKLAQGAIFDPQANEAHAWHLLPTLLPQGAAPRSQQMAAWTPQGLLIWGGVDQNGAYLRDGMLINPYALVPEWRRLNTSTTPLGRKGSVGFWTGDSFAIWGGYGENHTYLEDGARLFLPESGR